MKYAFLALLFILLSVSVLTAEVDPESSKVSKTILFSSGGVGQESVSAILIESVINHQHYQHTVTTIIYAAKTVRNQADLLTGFYRDIIEDRLKYAIEF